MDREQLEAAIAAQESLRGAVADEVIETTIAALRRQLVTLDVGGGQRRRQVSVLFADVSGFTAMSEALDAEDVSDVMNRAWERLDAVVVAHGGRIDKHIGDALMAIWGTETTREDDPERAVRAALGLQEAMADHRAEAGIELRMRVGVNTGPVMLGAVGSTGEFTALGDAVNLASRLEHAAPPDGVLISHDTYRHVKGVFSVSVQEPLSVKGKRRPVRTYVVEAVRPRAFRLGTRGVEGVETRMIGRDAEVDRLKALLSETVAGGTSRSVTLVGDAGVGKSRLLYEFEDWLQLQPTDVRLFKARADQQHAADSHFVIRDLLFSRFQIADDDPSRTALDKLTSGLRELAPTTHARDVDLIATLVGIETGEQSVGVAAVSDASLARDQMWAALAAFMERVAASMPVVVLLEDLHWADQASLEAVESLITRCTSSPMFVLQLARPALFERHAPAVECPTVRIDLAPLDAATTRRLVQEVLQNATDVPGAVLDELSTIAAGNPFFVEELVKVMIDDDTIVTGDEEWTVDLDRLDRTRPPATITGVLQARIDRLTVPERAVLERAAVAGRIFWDDAIANLDDVDGPPSGDLPELLGSLEAKELVFRQPASSFLGTRQYIFKHALLQDVAYDRVLKRDRARLHRAVADWLIRRGDSPALSGTIASHFDAAGDALEAAGWHARAGRHAARHFALDDAVAHLEAAKRATDLDAATRVAALEDLSEVFAVLARFDDGLEVADQIFVAATELDDPPRQAMALLERSHHLVRLGRLDDALAASARAEHLLASARTAPIHHMRVLTERGWIMLRLGRTREAIDAGSKSLSLAADDTSSREVRAAHSQLGAAFIAAGCLADAERHLDEALKLDRQRNNPRDEAADLINLGVLASTRGAHVLATNRYEAALRLTREIGDRDQEALALSNLGGVRVAQREYAAAIDHLTDALGLFDAANAAEHTSETHCLLARARLGLGDDDAALDEARVALRLAEDSGSADHLGNAWLTLGGIAQRTGGSVVVDDENEHDAAGCLERGTSILTAAGLEIELVGAFDQLAGVHEAGGDLAAASDLRRRASDARASLD
jgi:class 3 adenylate cyclase/tetratricopeptide (TPR) repeat protein